MNDRKLISWDFLAPALCLLVIFTILGIANVGIGAVLIALGCIGLMGTVYLTIFSD